MVEPSQGTDNLFGLHDGDFVWDGASLNDADSISEHFVTVLDGDIFEIDGVFGAVLKTIFYNINGIVLGIAQIDGILVDVTD